MADTRSKSYCIVEIDHSAEEQNAASPSTYVNPCKVLFMHHSLEKSKVELMDIIARYKTVQGTEKCKFQLDYKSPTAVEVREIYEGYIKTSKIRTKTILLCDYVFPEATK